MSPAFMYHSDHCTCGSNCTWGSYWVLMPCAAAAGQLRGATQILIWLVTMGWHIADNIGAMLHACRQSVPVHMCSLTMTILPWTPRQANKQMGQTYTELQCLC